MSKPNSQQVARAGEHFVAAELHRGGAYAVTFAGNMPEIDILASDAGQTRTVAVQVKTKRSGTWQTTRREWPDRVPEVAETRFWVFVDLHKTVDTPPSTSFYPRSGFRRTSTKAMRCIWNGTAGKTDLLSIMRFRGSASSSGGIAGNNSGFLTGRVLSGRDSDRVNTRGWTTHAISLWISQTRKRLIYFLEG